MPLGQFYFCTCLYPVFCIVQTSLFIHCLLANSHALNMSAQKTMKLSGSFSTVSEIRNWLALSNQQACSSLPSPDCIKGTSGCTFGFHRYAYVDCVEYLDQCTLPLWYRETSTTTVQRTDTAPLIDCIRQLLALPLLVHRR